MGHLFGVLDNFGLNKPLQSQVASFETLLHCERETFSKTNPSGIEVVFGFLRNEQGADNAVFSFLVFDFVPIQPILFHTFSSILRYDQPGGANFTTTSASTVIYLNKSSRGFVCVFFDDHDSIIVASEFFSVIRKVASLLSANIVLFYLLLSFRCHSPA